MYALPEENDLEALRAREVELVCFAANCVYVHLSNDAMLSILGEFRHQVAEGDVDAAEASLPLVGSRLMRIVGQTITDVRGQSDGTLTLAFTKGDVLTISGDSGPYEAYHLKLGDREIIV